MALGLTIDWNTFIINVPRTGMTLVQTVPTEIRQLDLNEFRLELKDIEDSIAGMPYPDTHSHNTEVSLGGITYARVVEILDPYSITFENGTYAVNLVGANSNVGDKVNLNEVSVRSNNSAGLISSPDVEFSSFNGGVMINVDDGFIGTIFPTGTQRKKSNNLSDAILIADFRGFRKIYADSNLTLDANANIDGYSVVGNSRVQTNLVVEESANVTNTIFEEVTINGNLDGGNTITDSDVGNITFFNGSIRDSGLKGKIILGGEQPASIVNSSQVEFDETPVIDMGGWGQDLVMSDYTGRVIIQNLTGDTGSTGTTEISIGLDHGQVVLDSTSVTTGLIWISGIGSLVDENGDAILSGTWNGDVTIINQLINKDTITEASQLGQAIYVDSGSTNIGTTFPIGSKRTPVNNLDDAVIIANKEGLSNIVFLSNYFFPDGTNIQDFSLTGLGFITTRFTFESTTGDCIIRGCTLEEATIKGNFTDVSTLRNCKLDNFGSIGLISSDLDILFLNCLFGGTFTLPSNYSGLITAIDSYSTVVGTSTPTIDVGTSISNIQFKNYTGGLKFLNATQGNIIGIDLLSGQVKLDPATVTGATIVVRGNGKVINADTSELIYSGVWNGGVTVLSEANTPEQTAKITWDEEIGDHLIENTMGHQMYHQAYDHTVHINSINGSSGTTFPIGTSENPVNNIDDAMTIAKTHQFKLIRIEGSYNINTTKDLSEMVIAAHRSTGNYLTLTSYACSGITYFQDITVSGTLTGGSRFTTSVLGNLANFDGGAKNCLLTGNINIVGNGANYFTDCDTYVTDSTYKQINIGDNFLNVIRGRGRFELANFSGSHAINIDCVAGAVLISSGCTSGTIGVSGQLQLTDESSTGCTVNDYTLTKEKIVDGVWEKELP